MKTKIEKYFYWIGSIYFTMASIIWPAALAASILLSIYMH